MKYSKKRQGRCERAAISKNTGNSTRSRSKQSLRLWLRMLSCESGIEQILRTRMRENFNTTLPQFDALAELIYFDRPLSMTELSARLKVSNGNITGLVDRLVRDSYAERVPDKNDRRVNLIVVTDYGREAFDKMALAHEAWIEEIFSGLSLQKINTLSSLLKDTQSAITR